MSSINIEFDSYINKKLSLNLYKQNSKYLVVLLPGHSYTNLAPLIFYSNNLAKELAFDTLSIEYPFQQYKLSFNFDNYNLLLKDIKEIIEKILVKESYEKIVFIGKSLGTKIQNDLNKIFNKYKIYNIYLTPLRTIIENFTPSPSLFIFGGNDPHFSQIDFYKIDKNYELLYFEQANHSLNTPNTLESLEILEKIIFKIKIFLEDIKEI